MYLNENSNVCIIGAGTMGAKIAAHLANLGFHVSLLDMTKSAADAGLQRAINSKPAQFYVPEHAERVRTGDVYHDIHLIREADWICEAIVENLEAKKDLYRHIEPYLRSTAILTTNTSGLGINTLGEVLSAEVRHQFMGTHFFNPPRYLKLVELIPLETTAPTFLALMKRFLEENVCRRVVEAIDTPGFIANRFGMWSMIKAIRVAEKLGLTIKQVDTITGAFLGRPNSGTFRLCDIIGLDVMRDINNDLYARCSDDPYVQNFVLPISMQVMIRRGILGEKVGHGYYSKENGIIKSLNIRTFEYEEIEEIEFESIRELSSLPLGERLRKALLLEDKVGQFLREYLVPTLQYAAYIGPKISHNVDDFDSIFKWGFNWKMGPFEMIDAIGPDKLEITGGPFYTEGKVKDSFGRYITVHKEPQYRKIHTYKILQEEDGFNIRDIEDKMIAISLSSKLGIINPEMVCKLHSVVKNLNQPFILCSEASSFSAGFDLNAFLEDSKLRRWDAIDEALQAFQNLNILLGQKKSIAAVHGYCLGGGYEIAGACQKIVAAAETHIGLPEAKVGLLPGGGGTARIRLKFQQTESNVSKVFKWLVTGKVFNCAVEAQIAGFLSSSDLIVHHPDCLISDAKDALAKLKMTVDDKWKSVPNFDEPYYEQLLYGLKKNWGATTYDFLIAHKVRKVFYESQTFEEALSFEREGFISLLQQESTIARIEHMLKTGKPLRN